MNTVTHDDKMAAMTLIRMAKAYTDGAVSARDLCTNTTVRQALDVLGYDADAFNLSVSASKLWDDFTDDADYLVEIAKETVRKVVAK